MLEMTENEKISLLCEKIIGEPVWPYMMLSAVGGMILLIMVVILIGVDDD